MLKGDSSRVIYFNEFLRFNDGLLVDYIADKEQIDKIEAAKKVKLFVDGVNKQLMANKSVELEGLGTLYLDINEKIQLKTPETSTVPPVNIHEPEVETSPREILFELEKPETKAEPAQPVSSTPIPSPPPVPAPPSQPKSESQSVVTKPSSSEPASKPIVDAAAKEEKVTPPIKEEIIDVVPTTTRRMIIVGIFGALVIAAIVYFAFFRVPKNANTNQNITIGDTMHKDSVAPKRDSTVKNRIAASISASEKAKEQKHKEKDKVKAPETKTKQGATPVQKAEAPKTVTKSVDGTKYYVIAGTFSIEANADKMLKKLKEEGYTSEKIRNDKKNVFYVSFSSFGDKKSAQTEMKKLKSSGKPDSWIYAY